MSIKDEFLSFTDGNGLICPNPVSPGTLRGSDNGTMYTSEFFIIQKFRGESTEQDKIDFQTLTEMGLRRLQVSDNLVLQESCAKSPTLIFAENGNVIEVIKYKKLLEIKSFIDEILNYADTPQIGVDDE